MKPAHRTEFLTVPGSVLFQTQNHLVQRDVRRRLDHADDESLMIETRTSRSTLLGSAHLILPGARDPGNRRRTRSRTAPQPTARTSHQPTQPKPGGEDHHAMLGPYSLRQVKDRRRKSHSEKESRFHEGLNIVENWSANGFVFFGKGGEIATNRIDEQEISALALHLLQASLVYVNTRMRRPSWWNRNGQHG